MDEALGRVARESGVEPVTSSRPELHGPADPRSTPTLLLGGCRRATCDRISWTRTPGGSCTTRAQSHEQAAVGIGRGIQGQPKKLSTSRAAGGFQAYDRLRPAEIVTLDLDHREHRWESLMDEDGPKWRPSDVASDTDNNWRDAAVVDAHAYAGFTYDWFARQGWHGMDGRNGRVMSMVNLSPDYANAYFAPPAVGTGEDRSHRLRAGERRYADRIGRHRGPRVHARSHPTSRCSGGRATPLVWAGIGDPDRRGSLSQTVFESSAAGATGTRPIPIRSSPGVSRLPVCVHTGEAQVDRCSRKCDQRSLLGHLRYGG